MSLHTLHPRGLGSDIGARNPFKDDDEEPLDVPNLFDVDDGQW